MKFLLILVAGVLLVSCSKAEAPTMEESQAPAGNQETVLAPTVEMGQIFEGSLSDVTQGVTVAGIVNTKGMAAGEVRATQTEDEYSLQADVSGLPELPEEYFYEGWVVRQEPLSVVSAGELTPGQTSGAWVNTFVTEFDFADHNRYVLTLEPRDDDPTPAEHLLEGELMEVAN